MTQQKCAGALGAWLAAASLGAVLVFSAAASAQSAFVPADQRPYASISHESLQQASQELESLAARARDQAKLDEHHGGRGEVTERMGDFAKHAHQLRLLAFERDVPASKINDQIRRLVDDGRNVQKELAKSKRSDPQTVAEWDRTIGALNQLNDQFMAANGLLVRPGTPVGTSGSYGNYGAPWAANGQTLLSDLNRRADDAARISQDYSSLGFAPDVQGLRDQVRQFGRQIDQLPPGDAHDRIMHMLSDARDLQRRLSSQDAPPQLRDDVAAMVGTLVQMRDVSGDQVQGTSGITTDRNNDRRDRDMDRDNDRIRDNQRDAYTAADRDRYATLDPVELTTELSSRAARAGDLATGADMDDVSSQIGQFNDRLRDFNSSSASMDRDERRDKLDKLLHDAQATQRDLARRHASTSLVNQWNAVVDLLTRLRDGA